MESSQGSISHCLVLAPKSIKHHYLTLSHWQKGQCFVIKVYITTLIDCMFQPAGTSVEQLLRHSIRPEFDQFDTILVYLRIHWWYTPQVNNVAPNNSGLKTFGCHCMSISTLSLMIIIWHDYFWIVYLWPSSYLYKFINYMNHIFTTKNFYDKKVLYINAIFNKSV